MPSILPFHSPLSIIICPLVEYSSHQLVTVTNDTYINAQAVCQLMLKLRQLTPELPIILNLDNARYQKCQLVWTMARDLKIELLYLPAYSPNLNLIERLWKFVKKKCLYSIYYADFSAFSKAISTCLDHTHDTYQGELDSLLTLNFQTFDNATLLSSMPS